eukprot:TRINITY_DN1555_c0_g2_i2.p2 TRINITY_DN1555_c0_g2~~TRINITY_DN1555_c0_g2_i2.p2  ORF type:complete len:254 (-),score=24.64 TRINITY_DN1555_c0_g2_i2:2-763(-)
MCNLPFITIEELAGRSKSVDMIVLLLFWLRYYLPYKLLGYMFLITDKTASNLIFFAIEKLYHYYLLKNLIQFPPYNDRIRDSFKMAGLFLSLIIDGTEQVRLSTENKDIAIAIFSGKKGAPTWTKLIGCSPCGRIYFISKSYFGSTNDPAMYQKSEVMLHRYLTKNEAIGGDKAFSFINQWHTTFVPGYDADYDKVFITFRHSEEVHNRVWTVLGSMHNEDLDNGLVLRDSKFWARTLPVSYTHLTLPTTPYV